MAKSTARRARAGRAQGKSKAQSEARPQPAPRSEAAPVFFRQDTRLGRLADRTAALTGWRRLLLAFALGAVSAAAFAPTFLVPLLWPAFMGLLWIAEGLPGGGARGGRARLSWAAFGVGWAFVFGQLLAGCYWVGISFLVDAPRYGFLAPIAVLALTGGLALYSGVAFAGLMRFCRPGLSRLFGLAGFWLLAELARGWLLTGFPWNLLGTVWAVSTPMLQFAALLGVWGLGYVTLLAAGAPALAAHRPGGPWRRFAPGLAGLALLGLIWAGGATRLALAPEEGTDVHPDQRLRLVQPAIDQRLKWKSDLRPQHVEDQIALSRAPGFEALSTVIWAETAVPYYLDRMPELQRRLTEAVPPAGPDGRDGLLIVGAPRMEDGRPGGLWNSLHALDREGHILSTYDKVHLVPFGEYVPLRGLFGFAKLTQGRIDFSPGPGLQTLDLPGLPSFSPLICYEVIYPGEVVARDAPRPDWLLTITNDGWFGRSSGPYQHFTAARLRAVEEGLPMVRVANTGISGVVDSYGRIRARLGLGEKGLLDVDLPLTARGGTLFATIGNKSVLLLLFISLLVCVFLKRLR